jgi:hypothetical protein
VRTKLRTRTQEVALLEERERRDKSKLEQNGLKKSVGLNVTVRLDEETLEIKERINEGGGSFSALVRAAVKLVADSAEVILLDDKMYEQWGAVLDTLDKEKDLTSEEIQKRTQCFNSYRELEFRLRQLQLSDLITERRGRWKLTIDGKQIIGEFRTTVRKKSSNDVPMPRQVIFLPQFSR